MLRVSNVAEPADIVPCLRELDDEASITVNPDGGFADFAAQHSEFITRLVVLTARPTERLLQESLEPLWHRMTDSRCKNFAGIVCGTISHYRSVSRCNPAEDSPVLTFNRHAKITGVPSHATPVN